MAPQDLHTVLSTRYFLASASLKGSLKDTPKASSHPTTEGGPQINSSPPSQADPQKTRKQELRNPKREAIANDQYTLTCHPGNPTCLMKGVDNHPRNNVYFQKNTHKTSKISKKQLQGEHVDPQGRINQEFCRFIPYQ